MNNVIDFMEVAGVVISAMGLAMSLEWLALNALLRLMPARRSTRTAR